MLINGLYFTDAIVPAISDCSENRRTLGLLLKTVYEQYYHMQMPEHREALEAIAEKIVGARVFGYDMRPIADLLQLHQEWTKYADSVYLEEGRAATNACRPATIP